MGTLSFRTDDEMQHSQAPTLWQEEGAVPGLVQSQNSHKMASVPTRALRSLHEENIDSSGISAFLR